MPKVSIIVPVYNVEKYLRTCLDSIVSQSLKDIEIVCVDDGSTDSCPRILDEYAANDSRVIVVHKQNAGYGSAMNTGVRACTGDYVGIVESDDYVKPFMYETLYEEAVCNRLDFVKSDLYMFWNSEKYAVRIRNGRPGSYYQIRTSGEREKFYEYGMVNWTGIYNRKFLTENDIWHNETPGASYQDNGFWLQVMAFAERGMWIDEAFYMYRQDNPNSSMKSKAKMMATMDEYDFALQKLEKKGKNREAAISNYYRMRECRAAFMRLDDGLLREYADVIVKQYEKCSRNMMIPQTAQAEVVMGFIQDIITDPDGVCQRAVEARGAVMERIHLSDRIILYGAGNYAYRMFKRLFDMGAWEKVSYVAVTDVEENSSDFYGKPVRKLEEYADRDKNVLVLIAVKRNEGIKELLCEKGYHNYIEIEDFLRWTYSIYG